MDDATSEAGGATASGHGQPPATGAPGTDHAATTDSDGAASSQHCVSTKEHSQSSGPCGATKDGDNDGVDDDRDVCQGHDDAQDADGDGVPDGCDDHDRQDMDDDGDGVPNKEDACPGHDDGQDADGDGVPDECDSYDERQDLDDDGDGIPNRDDSCPGHDDKVDSDGDGTPDGCDEYDDRQDMDDDGDGVANKHDRCPGGDDASDQDNDGTPDACDDIDDRDDDADGVNNTDDACEGHDDNADVDEDGIPDGCDPVNDKDADNDGVLDEDDQCPGHDDNVDADSDGIPDGCDWHVITNEPYDFGSVEGKVLRPGEPIRGCTTNFLYHYNWERFFLGSAAHCHTENDPETADGCDFTETEFPELGSTVEFTDTEHAGTLVYSSWIAMHSANESNENACVGNDFSLIEISPDTFHAMHNAPRWNIQQDIKAYKQPFVGQDVQAYGSSSMRCTDWACERDGGADGSVNTLKGKHREIRNEGYKHRVSLTPSGVPGDSGGPLLSMDGHAIGVASTIIIAPQVGDNTYADVNHALNYMGQQLGWRPDVVEYTAAT